jgi:hypothetical protein
MNDPILQAAVNLKKLTDEAKNPEIDAIMAEIMKTLLEASEPKK